MLFFSHASLLWWAVPLALATVVLALLQRRRGVVLPWSSGVLCAALLLLCLALADPHYETTEHSADIVALVDVSDSVDGSLGDALVDSLRRYEDAGNHVSVLPFAHSAAPYAIPLRDIDSFSALKNSWNRLDLGETNFEVTLDQALRLGAAEVLLASDGYQTKGDALVYLDSHPLLKVHPLVPPHLQQPSEVRIEQLHVPLLAPAQKAVPIRVSVTNRSEREARATLQVFHDKEKVHDAPLNLGARENQVVIVQSDPAQEGIKEIRAVLEFPDGDFSPSSAIAYLSSEQRERILLINGGKDDERLLKGALEDQGFRVQSITSSGGGLVLPDLKQVSVIVLNNVPANAFARSALGAIASHVKNGGGLVMIGGDRSFGLGGYIGTEVAAILPVELVPPQTEKKRLNVAVQLVLDKSRSMATDQRIEFAKEAAKAVVDKLKDDDYVGVIGFDVAPFNALDMDRLSRIRPRAYERIDRLFPTKSTNLLPALDEARRALVKADAGRKHMIVLTDGKIPDSGPYYLEFVRQVRLYGITVSTVLVGAEGDDGLLKSMAEVGGGGFYQTSDPRSLPRIFLSDLQVSTGEKTLREQQEFLVRRSGGREASTSIVSFPPVRGYVQTRPRPDAQLELVTMSKDKAEPLLASWDVGKGRSIAYTSDANGRWSSYWASWPKFHLFWSEILEAAQGTERSEGKDIKFDLRYYLESGELKLDTTLYTKGAVASVSAAVTPPSGGVTEALFTEVARGRFVAALKEPKAGKYEVTLQVDGQLLTPIAFHLPGDLFGEKRGGGIDAALLHGIAAQSGGIVNPNPDQVSGVGRETIQRTALAPWILLLVGVLLLCSILVREVGPFLAFRRI